MRHGEVLTVVIRSTDAAAVLLAAVLAFVGRFGWQAWPMTLDYALLAWIAALLLVVLCDAFGAYRSWRGMSLAQQGGVVVLGWALTWALLLLALFAFKESERYSRWWMGWWAALTLLLLLGFAPWGNGGIALGTRARAQPQGGGVGGRNGPGERGAAACACRGLGGV